MEQEQVIWSETFKMFHYVYTTRTSLDGLYRIERTHSFREPATLGDVVRLACRLIFTLAVEAIIRRMHSLTTDTLLENSESGRA